MLISIYQLKKFHSQLLLSMKTFSQRVVEAALIIPKGRVTTYGRLARACGAGPMASQSITGILAKAYKKYPISSHCLCEWNYMDK